MEQQVQQARSSSRSSSPRLEITSTALTCQRHPCLCIHQPGPVKDLHQARRAGRQWMRQQLARITSQPMADDAIVYSANGKPQWSGVNWGFSYTHSQGHLALLVAPGQTDVGLDMEKVQSRRPLMKIARRYFSPVETAALARLRGTDQTLAFYALWTAKEAMTKRHGGRLWLSLQKPVPVAIEEAMVESGPAETLIWLYENNQQLMLCLHLTQAVDNLVVVAPPHWRLTTWYWPV